MWKYKPANMPNRFLPKINIASLNLLVVDDNATNREVLKGQMELWGASVTAAESGKQALEICQQRIDQKTSAF